jgi:acylphosphatase
MPVSASSSAAEIHVEGRVQGVGYRDYALRRGSRLGLAGYVMNLRDGRVRARAEGPRAVIEEFVRDLEKGPPLSRVERVDVRWLPPTGRYAGFEVRYAEFEP